MGKQTRGRMFIIAGIIVLIGFFMPFDTFSLFHRIVTKPVIFSSNSLFNSAQSITQNIINIFTPRTIGSLFVGAVGILFLLFGCILIYTNITSTISTTVLKILSFILSVGVGGFLSSRFLSFGTQYETLTLEVYTVTTDLPNWGFYLIVVGVIIGAIALIIPDKEDKGNTRAEDNTDAKVNTVTK